MKDIKLGYSCSNRNPYHYHRFKFTALVCRILTEVYNLLAKTDKIVIKEEIIVTGRNDYSWERLKSFLEGEGIIIGENGDLDEQLVTSLLIRCNAHEPIKIIAESAIEL